VTPTTGTTPVVRAQPKIVIVGAGIVGASIAYNLSLRDADVTVVDASTPGMAASHASYAWINAHPKPPRSYHDLNRRSMDVWSRWERHLGGDVGITWGGELRWTTTGDGASEMRDEVSLMQSWGYPVNLITPDQLAEMEPGLVTDPITAATYAPTEGHVDTAAVIARALTLVRERGAELLTGTAVKGLTVETQNGVGKVTGVETEEAHVPADIVVLAAGYSTRELAADVGLDFPQIESPGATLFTPPMPPIFKTVACVHTPRDLPDPQMNIRQMPDGRVQVHGGTHFGSVGDNSVEDAEWMLAELEKFVPAIAGASVDEWRRAMRPMPGDGLPIIGYPDSDGSHNGPSNVYFSVMHSGVSLSALVGEVATLEILDNARVDFLEDFRYDRFLGV